MKRLFAVVLVLSFLLVGCQNGDITDTTEQNNQLEDPNDPRYSFEYKTYWISKNDDGFGFTLEWIEGKIERGETIRAKVWLINVMNEKHTWTGSSSSFQPYVKLICADTDYVIRQHKKPSTDDIRYHEILPWEKHASEFYFTIPQAAAWSIFLTAAL